MTSRSFSIACGSSQLPGRPQTARRRDKIQPILQFGGMTLSSTLSGEIIINYPRKSIDLLGDEREQRPGGRSPVFSGQARITQITEHECLSEAIMTRHGSAGSSRDPRQTTCNGAPAHVALSAHRTALLSGLGSTAGVVSLMPPGPSRPADQLIRSRELIKVLRLMPKVRQTAALVGAAIEGRDHRRELLGIDGRRAASSSAAPLARRLSQPAPAPGSSDRSNCASAPKTWNRNSPCGVVVSICSVSERNATPRALRSFTVVRRCGSDRPRRSSFQTTKQSPGRRKASAFAKPGAIAAGCR